jgi:hypothetical protein
LHDLNYLGRARTNTGSFWRTQSCRPRRADVGIVVADLAAATAFFAELGLELEGQTTVEGPSVDRLVGLRPSSVRCLRKATDVNTLSRQSQRLLQFGVGLLLFASLEGFVMNTRRL